MMRNKRFRRLSLMSLPAVLLLCVLVSCVTTKNLPEGEILYMGQKSMIVKNRSTRALGAAAMEEVESALAAAPKNAFL